MAKKNLVAYCPKGILAPVELLAVMVPVGVVTKKIWTVALSDRISDMVELEPNPQDAAEEACRALDCPICTESDQLGQFIVGGNLNLMTWINNSIVSEQDPFSGYATDDDLEALEAIKNTDLGLWINHAQYLMTGSRLEAHMSSYEPSEDDEADQLPDKEIKPYIDFIDKHALAKCDLEVNDTDEVDLLMPFYDFSYSLRHKYERIILSTSIYLIEQLRYDSLTDFDELVKKFNVDHASKVSYHYDQEKKWFFSKVTYKPRIYFLTLESSLSKEPKEINITITRFYEDLRSLFNYGKFGISSPKPRSDDIKDITFSIFLENQIKYLRLLKKYPDYMNNFEIDEA
jgi:hypothetical protein